MAERKERKEKTQDQTAKEKLGHLEEQREALDMKIEEAKEEAGIGFWNRKVGHSLTTLGEQAIKGIVIITCITAGITAGNLAADALSKKGGISEV